MCYSAEASFSISGLLLGFGGLSISKRRQESELYLATIPLLFACQQISEGLLWLSLENRIQAIPTQVLVNIFVIFGQTFWPVWIPFSCLMVEKNIKRKKLITNCLILGFFISAYLLYLTIKIPPTAIIEKHHMKYLFNYPSLIQTKLNLIYLIPTVFALLLSSQKKINRLGLLILASFFISEIIFSHFVFSIWCFFAAFLSLYIYSIIGSLSTAGPTKIDIRLQSQ